MSATSEDGVSMPSRGARKVVVLITLLFVVAVAWAWMAKIEEVTRGSGKVIPSSRTQVVQSSEPGIVQEILVRQGQEVKRGALLIRIDDTQTGSKVGEAEAQRRALTVQIARLEAEAKSDAQPFACPDMVQKIAPDVCANEQRLYSVRKENLDRKLDGARQRIEQRQREIGENNAQLVRLTDAWKFAEKELGIVGPMASRNLISQVELLRVQRQLAETKGLLAVAKESTGRLKAALEEANVMVAETIVQFRREAINEITLKRAELSVLEETLKGAEDRVRRTEVRSPVDGVINTLAVTTIGAYVNAGDRLVDIVPTEDRVLIETRVKPSDIAFIAPTQPARIKVSAYDFYQYGGLDGKVDQISPDSVYDQQTKESYYIVMISSDARKILIKDKSYSMMPGMIADIDIITGEKTVLSYLLKPIRRGMHESLTER